MHGRYASYRIIPSFPCMGITFLLCRPLFTVGVIVVMVGPTPTGAPLHALWSRSSFHPARLPLPCPALLRTTAHSTLVSLQFLQAAGTGYPPWPTPWPLPLPPSLPPSLAPSSLLLCWGLGLGLGWAGAALRFAFTLLAPSVRDCVEVLLRLLRPPCSGGALLGGRGGE